jgi:hypothetical protein
VRRLLGWTTPELSGKIQAGLSSLNNLVAGEFILFNTYATYRLAPPISSFLLLLLEEFGFQLQHLNPHSVLLVAIFAHFMEMFVGVHPCVPIFKHFYALVGIGRSKREIGAYYFQLRHGMSSSYISAFSSAKWKDWGDDWVIATTDANDRLELPTEGTLLDRSSWKARPSLPVELDQVLDRVKTLARGGLTSMIVLGDFLRHHIAPIQQRSKMACMFTGVNDCSRIVGGAGSDLSGAELEVLVPRGIKALCEDQALRTVVLASMLTLDEGGLAVQQVGGDPNHGIRIPSTSPDSQQHAVQIPGESCHGGPASAAKGKGKEPELRHKYNVRSGLTRKDDEERAIPIRKDDGVHSIPICKDDEEHAIPIRKDDEVRSIPIHRNNEEREAATSRSSRDREEAGSRRLCHGDGSYVGEPAPKRQKMAESGGRAAPGPRHRRCNASSRKGGQRRRCGLRCSIDHRHLHSNAKLHHRRHHLSSSSRPGEEVPPDTWGILLREEGNPDYIGRMGGARLHVSGNSSCFSLFHLISGSLS